MEPVLVYGDGRLLNKLIREYRRLRNVVFVLSPSSEPRICDRRGCRRLTESHVPVVPA